MVTNSITPVKHKNCSLIYLMIYDKSTMTFFYLVSVIYINSSVWITSAMTALCRSNPVSTPGALRQRVDITQIVQACDISWARDSIRWFYSCNKSSHIRSVYSQCHVDILKCTEQNVKVSQLYVHVSFCLKVIRSWLNLPTGGHGPVLYMGYESVYMPEHFWNFIRKRYQEWMASNNELQLHAGWQKSSWHKNNKNSNAIFTLNRHAHSKIWCRYIFDAPIPLQNYYSVEILKNRLQHVLINSVFWLFFSSSKLYYASLW